MKIGVIAGTPVDTKMGLDYVISKGFEGIMRPCSKCPNEQTNMQLNHPKELAEKVVKLSKEMIAEGAEGIYIYCNSMSTALDLNYVRSNLNKKVVTPLDVYAECAQAYQNVFAIAANCQALAGIELVIKSHNPNCLFSGASLLSLVSAIEKNIPPETICSELNISELLYYFTKNDAEVLVLGCTHFPYILDQIKEALEIPILDPGQRMLEMLCEESPKA
jgi:glutamate racemase